ncbi:cadherin-related family member 3-like [Engystomops pustulosus]|uniref:cadherin-related family member 3-like n=1 Tax=Engystomops pustulosus TaxID=76066 RepID=UPI003AFAD60B
MFTLDQCEKSSSVLHKERKKQAYPSRLRFTCLMSAISFPCEMMVSKQITTAFFIFEVITHIIALNFDKESPLRLPEGRTENQEIARAIRSRSTFQIGNSVPFRIDPNSGIITATKDFDFEDGTPRIYDITVIASNGLLNRESADFTVIIENVNEPPKCDSDFQAKRANRTINENFPMYTSIYRVPAIDEDGDILTFSLQSQKSGPTPNGLFFDVDKTIGFVFRNASEPLDFDAGYEEFRLLLTATDPDGLSCDGGLVIYIRDLNDEPPVFVKIENDTIYVPENTLIGSILEVFEATDRDAGSTIVYGFPGQTSMFNINPVTGALTLLQPLDYDNPDEHKAYALVITATDRVHTTNYLIHVFIENVDEPPECDPAFSTGTGITLTVPETFPTLTKLYTILAEDPDEEDDVTFEMTNFSLASDVFFTLNSDTGIISTTDKHLDYESEPKKFVISIKVRNIKPNPMFCTGLITISLQNENDETPVFQNFPNQTIDIPENLPPGTVVLKVQATDRDIGDSVHYEFFTTYPGLFIDEDTGEIKIAYLLDYEDPNIVHEQRLVIHAFDNDRVHVTAAELSVKLIDVNDNYPQCEGYPNMIQVAETTAINSTLLQIICVDKDLEEPNNVLNYSLNPLDEFSAKKFTLKGNTIISGPESLDYDHMEFSGMQFRHILLIDVSDSGTPSLTSTVTVIVRVTRVNEFDPDPSINVFAVFENSPVGSLVGTTKFTDIDWPFDNIKFTFAGGDYGSPPKFYIEPDTGIIKVRDTLDFEKKNKYSITVQATDLNNDVEADPLRQRSSLDTVIINIINVNDEPPVCSPAYYEKIIYSTQKTPVLKLQCSDMDSPDHQLNYAVVSENKANRFTLQRDDEGPPFVIPTQNFQYNVFEGIQDPTVFQMLIEVTDERGGNKALQLSTTATVIIHVVPWTTTIPTTTLQPTTVQVTTAVLVRTSYFWHPDNWFPAVITITATLFLLCLYAVAWGILKDVPKYSRFFPTCQKQQPKPPNLPNKSFNYNTNNQSSSNNNSQSNENQNFLPQYPTAPNVFDGRAVDPVSGNHFLFNSITGETQWVN